MNIDFEVEVLRAKITQLEETIDAFNEKYKEAREYTANFLSCCQKHGIKTVAVQVSDERVPESVGFAFGCRGNVFASESENGWPAIWASTREAGAYGGCGNTGQAQLSRTAQVMLIDGCYRFENGSWMRIDED